MASLNLLFLYSVFACGVTVDAQREIKTWTVANPLRAIEFSNQLRIFPVRDIVEQFDITVDHTIYVESKDAEAFQLAKVDINRAAHTMRDWNN